MADGPRHLMADDARAAVDHAAAWLAAALTAADAASLRAGHAGARLAIPGGSALAVSVAARARLDDAVWARLALTFVDDRRVPHDDPESNAGAATRAGLYRRGAPRLVLRLHEDGETPAESIARAEAAFARDLGGLDVILLGVGEDGHVASLFPDLPPPDAGPLGLVAHVARAPKPPPERLTLTASALAAAGRALVVALGAGKRAAVARVLARDPALAVSGLGNLTVITDRLAGAPP